MAGQIASFVSGSLLVIKINNNQIAYAQSLSFSENMSTQPVGGIGSYSYQAIEPLMYTARGSLQIMRYLTNKTDNNAGKPGNYSKDQKTASPESNSLMNQGQFNPAMMLISQTFDIEVYEKAQYDANGVLSVDEIPLYVLKDCRLTNYNMAFSPGQLLSENVDYVCLRVLDANADGTDYIQATK